ncbi:uncharacterized protein EV420DRAFT_935726 [Desarmillaria tabescens]|uniref:CBF1-interacting co-repressor CIR N-terminal domain-containing protein n=1 Tax=Armillaria tabescens TaxID=1929756 RepID=A0AA39NG72_ARMTA|nr:uncharacterized protein EV420DRAFT_935726 [Desarmillaria tabescens]KAK0465052.1 hypothetical protein EV420DRAFT_935726 [Desarmillaria tabescens]
MGKLNIAHHKSYHPYRRDNIERVRRDEEEAREKEAREEGRMMLADSEARIDLLRERAGAASLSKKKGRDDDMKQLEGAKESLPTSGGHINFFEDLEQNAIITTVRSTKKAEPKETDKGVPLAPSAKDLRPWYSERNRDRDNVAGDEAAEERRKRDTARKSIHDPLTSITHQLASKSSSSSSSRHRPRPPSAPGQPPEVNARITRELSERERALALIRRKKAEERGSETPSTVHGGTESEYGDMYNRREVEEAHRGRWESSSRRYQGRHW